MLPAVLGAVGVERPAGRGVLRQHVVCQRRHLPVDFLPGSWLLHIDELNATMTMGQPFPDVWLPQSVQFLFQMSLALGPIDAQYVVDYYDYRQAGVTTRVKIR